MSAARGKTQRYSRLGALALVFALAAAGAPALESVEFATPGADDALRERLLAASLVRAAGGARSADAQAIFAAAQADYAKLVGVLYSQGYYSGVVRILIDGQEAGNIAAMDAPESIRAVRVEILAGPRFKFLRARMKPYAEGTVLPPAYADGKVAFATAIEDAARAGIEGWRNAGHAKARISDQSIVADHAAATIDARILLDPGPRLTFGRINIEGYERMNPRRLAKIAGFPSGEVFDPAKAAKVADRLRRTGVFHSVSLTEAEAPNPDGTLDFDLTVTEEALRRLGFGAELATTEGLTVSGYWMHRNLFGGGERFRVDAAVTGIGTSSGNIGYDIGARIDRPATPVADGTAFVEASASRQELVDQTLESLSLGLGLTRVLGPHLNAEAGIAYLDSTATDAAGKLHYRAFSFPVSLELDRRDSLLDPTSGHYLSAGVTPFAGLGSTGSGAQFKADGRIYRAFGPEDGVILAGRLQLGAVVGPALIDTPPDYLFFSGGGGTVRGHPYQSLGVTVARSPTVTIDTGGQSFIGLSGEIRAGVSERIQAVAFYDTGFVGPGALGAGGTWHAGAGLGLRYKTGFGPIRFDVAAPVSGPTGGGVQFYVGIGQAF